MKRNRKDKIYSIIGRAVTYLTGYVLVLMVSMKITLYVVTECITTIK